MNYGYIHIHKTIQERQKKMGKAKSIGRPKVDSRAPMRERLSGAKALKNIAKNHRKPKVFEVEYFGKKYLDITDLWHESVMDLPDPKGDIVQLMRRTKSYAAHK